MTIQAIIFAGSEARRLRPLSYAIPKPLAPVCNISVLERLISQLTAAGFDAADIIFPVLSSDALQTITNYTSPGFRLSINQRTNLQQGCVAATRSVLHKDAKQVLIIYGDSLLKADIKGLLCCHQENQSKGALATILYHKPPDFLTPEREGRTYHGAIRMDSTNRITYFKEKPLVEEIISTTDVANAAVFVCERSLLEGGEFFNAKDYSFDVFEPLASHASASPLFAYGIGNGFRRDLGTVERLFDANMDVLSKRLDLPIPGSELFPNCWIEKNAEINNSQIHPSTLIGENVYLGLGTEIGPNVVIGRGSVIGDNSIIKNSLIMEHVTIGEGSRLDYCVVGAHSEIGHCQNLPRYTILGRHCSVGALTWMVPS